MNRSAATRPARTHPVAPVALLLLLAGCAAPAETSTPAAPDLLGADTVRISLDGDVSEWRDDSVAVADGHDLFLRFTIDDERFAVQAAPKSVVIFLDVDGSDGTGRTASRGPLKGLGADYEIVFSPAKDDGASTTTGMRVRRLAADGTATPITNADARVTVAPTYAATWYEARIGREIWSSLAPAGTKARGVVALRSPDGRIEGYADPFEVAIPPALAPSARLSAARIPAHDPELLRVMSLNVLKSSPVTKPAPFGRLIAAIDPDILLLQEWDEGDAQAVASWLNANVGMQKPGVGEARPWTVRKGPGGVAVASRDAIATFGPETVEIEDTGKKQTKTVRHASTLVQSRFGPIVAVSVHLKCCGGATGPEEGQRRREAVALNLALAESLRAAGAPVIIGGDFNLVGTREPLDLLRGALDVDGSALAVADAVCLGDPAVRTTWTDWATPFPPGRLDYVTYADAAADVVRAFSLETTLLDDSALAASGLDRTDGTASDHRPLVVDLRVRPKTR
jgi:endonuclease/exonuclease/phosphatase family metal-dependent hydrolase